MYVLMDIEWVTNRHNHISPTQIAAMRVDNQWRCVDRMYSRIRPRDASFHTWNHMAYTGGQPSDFLYAKGIFAALSDLQNWLQDDDTICFWSEDSKNILKSVYNLVLKIKVPQRIVILDDYVFPYLKERKMVRGNPYRICSEYGEQAAGPKHNSENDVVAMQMTLGCIQYPANLLEGAPPKPVDANIAPAPKPVVESIPDELRPFQFDLDTEIFHKKGCPEIPPDARLTGHNDLKFYFRKKLTACPCCMTDEVRKAHRERNLDIINRSQYRFVFADNSMVFHRRDCGIVLGNTSEIRGSHYYKSCEETGRRPCKVCNPTPDQWYMPKKKKRKRIELPEVEERSMTTAERQAVVRHQRASKERYANPNLDFLSETEKDDFFTLTQPRFAFFAARGYATFHRRECPKLQGLNNLRGFARFGDARHLGLTPCKHCKPTKKQDILCSIPITSRSRADETVGDLRTLCKQHGFPCSFENGEFAFTTPAGKWKIDTTTKPYMIYHINLAMRPDCEYYHRQPRLFLSLLDIFEYVSRHDEKLIERTTEQQDHVVCEATG